MASVLEEKDAIRELMARYCFAFDRGRFDEWVELFTEDGCFDLGERGYHRGREALRKFLRMLPLTNGVPGMQHCVMNPIVHVDGTSATADSYVVVQGGPTVGILVAGRYEDRLVQQDGGWRFLQRRVHFDLMPAQ